MSTPVLLLVLRLLGAVLLLAFLGAIAWFIYKDIQLALRTSDYQVTPRAILRVLASDADSIQEGEEFSLSVASGIGRAPVNLIVLDDEFTSNRHALITWNGEQWLVEDLDSRNGTLVNDLPVDRQTVIVSDDILTVGRTRFKLE